jgi:hypothetical protein
VLVARPGGRQLASWRATVRFAFRDCRPHLLAMVTIPEMPCNPTLERLLEWRAILALGTTPVPSRPPFGGADERGPGDCPGPGGRGPVSRSAGLAQRHHIGTWCAGDQGAGTLHRFTLHDVNEMRIALCGFNPSVTEQLPDQLKRSSAGGKH